MAEKFKLKNFAEQCEPDKFYRLDILRGVSFDEAYDPSMPFRTLIVNFSLYKPFYQSLEEIKAIPAKDIFKSFQVENDVLELKVDVTNQIFLKPGTVWKNGSPVWEPSEFFNVSINQSQSKFVTLSSEKKSGTKMPFIQNGLGVQFVKYPNSKINGNTVDILIPTTEIIRYYFSGSTYFTQQLFNGALKSFEYYQQANKLFYDFNFDKTTKTVYIWLKRHCYDSDAVLIARALADSEAMKAMSYIYASLTNTKKNFNFTEACPRTNLPFSDGTDMEVLGQWLPPRDGEEEFTTFIVRTIEKCEHSFPFHRVEIESLDSYKSSGAIDNESSPKPSYKKERKDNSEQPELTQDEKPTNGIEAEELEFYQQRFSHLHGDMITKVKKVSEKEKVRRFKEEEDATDSNDGSSLPGDYSKDNNLQAWQNRINDAEPIPISDRITSVSNAVSIILNKRQDLSAQELPVGCTDYSSPFRLYDFERPKGKSGNYSWDTVVGRQRKALFLAISNQKGQTVYLLEIEGKEKVGFSLFLFGGYQGRNLDESNGARSLLFQIANNSGNGIASKVLNDFEFISSLKHIATDDDSFVDRVHRAINSVFNDLDGRVS
ncbi:hypothetical protein GHNINEIG_00195 [Hydrogenovibrio crunogenus]|uniref:TnsE C-terminal domain-containing protein n=1 Tax=Hydrogenovibrio crunogenus TaxID=39765 RepID=A0A4P7NWT8_9GAMM|nr:hypothetical protein [Hydrogenovibrio crunogenus]QBZ82171.1 hypothetical protein GHNINEIG_00195 [Hydrogenovibrio crunogenus]